MVKKNGDLIKFWPIIVSVVLVTGSYFTLKAGATEQDKRLTKAEDKIEAQSKETSSILINQASEKATLEQLLAYVKDIKESNRGNR